MQSIKIYSMRVAMLCRLYDLKLINDKEYTKKSSPQSCVKYYTMFYRSLIDQT